MKSSTMPGVITAIEAARFLRVSKATVLRLANKRLLMGVKIGRQWRFSKQGLLNLLNDPKFLKKIGSTL